MFMEGIALEKNLEYYMKLNYPLEVIEVPEEEGGGVIITIPILGRASMNAYGETFEEARAMLDELKKDSFSRWLKEGLPIPEPEEADEEYSGHFALRMPKFLHRMLAEKAKRENASINSLINILLSLALSGSNVMDMDKIKEIVKAAFKECFQETTWNEMHVIHHIGVEHAINNDIAKKTVSQWYSDAKNSGKLQNIA